MTLTQNGFVAEPKRGRGRPRKHPSWVDVQGVSRALRDHPWYDTCRNFQARSEDSDADAEWAERTQGITPRRLRRSASDDSYRLVPEWSGNDNLAAFVYGVAAEVGMKPKGERYWDLKAIDPSRPIGPGNVRAEKRPEPQTARAIAYRRKRAERIVELPSGAHLIGSEADALVHKPSCESTHLAPIECPCCSAEVETAEHW